jgi:putative transposase
LYAGSSCRNPSRTVRKNRSTGPNALAETTIGLYKTECVREGSPFRTGPLRTLADLEDITSAWVHWYNTSRLMHRLRRRPPAEAEGEYYAHLQVGQHTDHT